MKKNYKLLKVLLIMFIFIIISLSIAFFSIYYSAKLNKDTVVTKKAELQMVDSDNCIIINEKLYHYIKYENISPNIINAFISLEDKRFFKHNGIDYYRTIGALFNDIKTLSFKEGGSTITQQLAKNTQLGNEKTLKRKIKEMRLARLIEKNYSKEEILEMYLNAIYFGNGIYGIDSACKNYFGKSSSDISPAEGALLAGIVKSPAYYSPKNNLEASISRRNLVLKLMFEQKYITENEYNSSINQTYCSPISITKKQSCTPYFNNALIEAGKLLNMSEKALITSKYKIYTYFSKAKQEILHSSATSKEYIYVNDNGYSADVLAMLAENSNGGIVALYGNDECDIFSFHRQPGSIIKPIIAYAPAIEKGIICTETPILDENININGYSPKNYNNINYGWLSAENALSKSVNTVAVKLLNDVGIEYGKSFAVKCGMNFSQNDSLASALGGLTNGLTIPEISESYMTLANRGNHIKNTFIRKIETNDGIILYENKNRFTHSMSEDTAYLTTSMLENTVRNGTASKLNGFNYSIASKTGTTQSTNCKDNLDAWNVSYTTENTLTVWYGNTSNKSESSLATTGSGYPTLLAKKIYSQLNSPFQKNFRQPETVFSMEIDTFALEKNHEIYICNNSTPNIYRKQALFSISNCPINTSPYFDINNISFEIIRQNNNIYAEIASDEDYTFRLIQNDLLKNLSKTYAFNESGRYLLENEDSFSNKLYGYELLVSYNGIEIGKIKPQIMPRNDFIDDNELFQRRQSLFQ